MTDKLERLERWANAADKFSTGAIRLLLVFCGGVLFAVLVFIGCYIATGGK